MFTKKDLKDGMFGIDREGLIFRVDGDNLVYEDTEDTGVNEVLSLSYFKDDLTAADNRLYGDVIDIMKLCNAYEFFEARENFENNVCIIFDRDQKRAA